MGSKHATSDEKGPLYLCTTTDFQTFWSRESIRCGVVASVTKRTQGEKYLDRDNKEQVVKKNGLNFDFIVGTANDIANLAAAKAALASLATI